MTGPVISGNAGFGIKDIHLPRTQREAGIEYSSWENRLAPMRSWLQEIVRAAGIAAFVGILIFFAAVLTK